MDDFVEAALSTKAIINTIGKQVFQNQISYEIVMLPAQDGSLLKRIGIIVSSIGGSAWVFLHSPIGIAYVEGLTGHEPTYWARKIGASNANLIENLTDEKKKSLASKLVVQCSQGFLEKTEAEMANAGITVEGFSDAYKARNRFYETCINNPKINGIGFNETPVFPIPRSEFTGRLVSILDKPDDDEWVIKVVSLRIESPTWNPDGRQWVGKFKDTDEKMKEAHFKIEDDVFWLQVMNGGLRQVKVGDNMLVQWARPRHRGTITARVFRVLEFNGQKISQPLTDVEIQTIMAKLKYRVDDSDGMQGSLDL
ncbi:MAG: hypothetical protein GC129_02075 [Proteobacteria bacterium]|nr:hypothetical protein [Pseudomonadota bacterium]